MFGLSALYTKLLLSAGVILLVGAAYLYVTGLQNRVKRLNENNIVLTHENKALEETIKFNNEFGQKLDRVLELGNQQRNESREVKEKQLKGIDQKVKDGKDRPVGPLLKEFLNEK
jgi:hypothetical protein